MQHTSRGMLGLGRTPRPAAAPLEAAQLCRMKDQGVTDDINKIVLILSIFPLFQGSIAVATSTPHEPKANTGDASSVSQATSALGGLRKGAQVLIGMINQGQ